MNCTRFWHTLLTGDQLLITAIICSLLCFIVGVLVGILVSFFAAVRYVHRLKGSTNASISHTMAVYEEVSPDSLKKRKNDIELNENVAYGPVSKL